MGPSLRVTNLKPGVLLDSLNSDCVKTLHRRNLGTLCSEVVLLLLSSFVLAMAFPSFCSKDGWNFLAFIALIPLFYVIKNTTWKAVGFYGFLYGFVYYWIFNYWLSAFHPLANILVQVIKGAEMVPLFFALKAAQKWFSDKVSFLIQAVFWVAYTYLAQSWFAGYPYGTVCYAIARYRILIQISDICGIWGVTFMMVLPQAFLGSWLCSRFSKTQDEHCDGFVSAVLKSKIVLAVWCVLFVFQVVYGIVSVIHWSKAEPDDSVRIATVQHNHDSWKGGYATYKSNFINLQKMTLEAMVQKPDMVVWSETAFVPSVQWYSTYPYTGTQEGETFDYLRNIQGLVDSFVEFGSDLGVPLLTGNPYSIIDDESLPPYDEEGNWNKKDYNAVILFDDGKIQDAYLKQHLVPFTEHFPYEKQLPWLYNMLKANDYNWWETGTESKVFTTSNGIRFSTPICFEDIFGYLCADFVKEGADILINMTNDSWSGSVAAERQHSAMAVFRAVENRKAVLRGTNSGITCLISPTGKITDEMKPFKMGWKIWDVPVYKQESFNQTLYTRCSDAIAEVFVYSSYALLAVGLAFALNRKFKKK